jgi:hypothetical protein
MMQQLSLQKPNIRLSFLYYRFQVLLLVQIVENNQ